MAGELWEGLGLSLGAGWLGREALWEGFGLGSGGLGVAGELGPGVLWEGFGFGGWRSGHDVGPPARILGLQAGP